VDVLVREGPDEIRQLINMSVPFDRKEDGSLSITLEGGHHMNRIVHAGGDATGRETVKTLVPIAQKRENISVWEHSFFWDIEQDGSKVIGAWVVRDAQLIFIRARAVILCTGGAGRVYSRSTNPWVATGDGIGACVRAGVKLSNMQFVQFHPTGLYDDTPNSRAFLISEAMRGEGGKLRSVAGERFMASQHPLEELAPRDIVSRAIVHQLSLDHEKFVNLDITHRDGEFLQKRFPTIYAECLRRNIRIEKDFIPVSPVQHYMVGGIQTDLWGETNLKGLFAVGECACTGVHGANRLASNSMLECLVFGHRCATMASSYEFSPETLPDANLKSFRWGTDPVAENLSEQIRETCDTYAGIIRTPKGMKKGYEIMQKLLDEAQSEQERSRDRQEACNLALTGLSILQAAQADPISRGCHYVQPDER
jgi:L-aspartate oxidase